MFLPPEIESGNKEYKLKIVDKSVNRLEKLASQLKWRLQEGNGLAEYYIGVADNGNILGINDNEYIASLKNLNKIAKIINAKVIKKEKKIINENICYYVINITNDLFNYKSIRIIFIGPTNSGKSTIIGNLSKKMKDDGNGKSRKYVFNHKHEIYSGETSSISLNNLILKHKNKNLNINLIDTPGNTKYIKTMITAINKYLPDCIFLVLDPLEIDINKLRFYLEILNYYEYPFQIILSKKDKYDSLHKRYLVKNILEFNIGIKKISLIELDNLNNFGYHKLLNIIKNSYNRFNLINRNDIDIQICDVLNIPNFSKIYTGLTFKKININDNKILVSSDKKFNINFKSIYFLDKPIDSIDKGHLITFTINEINIDNKSDLIIVNSNIDQYEKINIKSVKQISSSQGICIYNNQYKVVKIKYKDNYKYELSTLDQTNFINLSNKIIIKINETIYFTTLII